jgi:hypothetical protein
VKLKKERNEKNHIEAKLGQGENAYGLASIKVKGATLHRVRLDINNLIL